PGREGEHRRAAPGGTPADFRRRSRAGGRRGRRGERRRPALRVCWGSESLVTRCGGAVVPRWRSLSGLRPGALLCGRAGLSGQFPVHPPPILVGVSAEDLAAGPDADAGGVADAAGVGLRAGGAGDRRGVLVVADAELALVVGVQPVLTLGPLPVVAAGLIGARAARGPDLLPVPPRLHGVVPPRRGPGIRGPRPAH